MLYILSLFIFQIQLPSWFYETPENSVVVVVQDSETRQGRTISLFKHAIKLISMENESVHINGNNAFLKQNINSQKDRIEMVYDVKNEFDSSVLKESGYVLLDYERFPRKFIIALFGKPEATFDRSREFIAEEPDWSNENKFERNSSIGIGSDNVVFYSNWLEAFHHAIYNIGHNKSVYTYQQLRNESSEANNSFYKVNINFVDAKMNGLRITHRWFDPKSNRFVIRMKEVRN